MSWPAGQQSRRPLKLKRSPDVPAESPSLQALARWKDFEVEIGTVPAGCASDLLQRGEMERLCKLSGGVLRDLVALARNAGEIAYMDGSEDIKLVHVKAAARQLGQGYLRGLSPDQVKDLRKLSKHGAFDLSSKVNVELLVTRRVLEYSATDFRVHPTLELLISRDHKQKNV